MKQSNAGIKVFNTYVLLILELTDENRHVFSWTSVYAY